MPPAANLRRLGLRHWRANRLEPAAYALHAAIAHAPADPALWRDLAGIQQAAGNDADALHSLDRSLQLDPAHAATWRARAVTATRIGDHPAADRAFVRALMLDPVDPDIHLGLGLLRLESDRLQDAIQCFRRALQHAPAHSLAGLCLAHALYAVGDFPAAAVAFETLAPLDAAAQRKLSAAALLRVLIEEGPDGFDVACSNPLSGHEAVDLLNHYGHARAAIALGRHLLAQDSTDAVLHYQVQAIEGAPLDRAPPGYIERHFDGFAATFDQKLVAHLGYRVPEDLTAALTRSHFDTALDLGCGTGLAAPHLAPRCTTLIGVDLSTGMLERAADRSLYSELQKAEATEFLVAHPAAFDLIFAADLLIYLGDVAPLFAAAAAALAPGGILAISLEATTSGTYVLQPSGRFAHALPYILALAAPSFTVLSSASSTLRFEGRRPVLGHLLTLGRPVSPAPP